MAMTKPTRIPLRNRAGDVIAEAVVDEDDYDRVVAEGRWSLSLRGYAYRRVQRDGVQREVKMHRFVLGLTSADPMVDHRDRDPLNNRKDNLRTCSNAENGQNRDGFRRTSRHRGVFWDAGIRRWRAQGSKDRRTVYLGTFDTEDEAAAAASAWRRDNLPFSQEAARA